MAREIRHVAHVVADVPDSHQPMKDSGPDRNPNHHLRIESNVMKHHDVVDGIIKERYETRNANDGDGLGAHGTEDDARKGR